MKKYLTHLCSCFGILHPPTLFRRRTDGLFLLGLGAILLSFGFLFGNPSPNHTKLLEVFNQYHWAVIFFVYGAVKFIATCKQLPVWARLSNGLIGLWAWTYLLLSFTIYDPTPFAPTEVLLFLPVILEGWILGGMLADKEDKGYHHHV